MARPVDRHSNPLVRWLVLAALAGGVGAATAAIDGKAARYYEDALARYDKRDLPGAIIQLKNALQIDRTMLPVQVLLGKALLGNGEAVAAEVALQEALKLGVNRAEVVLPLAQALIAQGKHKLVIEQQRFSPAGLPAAVQVPLILLRAAAQADLGDMRSAFASIEEARAINPRSAEAQLAEVPMRIRARQFAEAGAAAERGLALAPTSAEAWYQKGSVRHVQGDLAAALAAYERALGFDAKHLESRIARAGLLIDLARFADAAKEVADAQRIAPTEPRAAYLKGLLAERDGDPAAARNALREVTRLLDPVPIDFIRFRPLLLLLNGLAHFGLDERQKAKPYLEVLQKVQANSAASKLLAQIYLTQPDVPSAINVLETYLKAQPADGQAMVLLASANLALGRHGRATSLMQEALRQKDSPAFHTVLGLSLVRSGQPAGGLAELEAAYRKDAAQTPAATALIALYLRGGQSAKGVAVAEALVKQQPANASFQNLLGMARASAGDAAGARAAFEQALKMDASLVPAQLNLARLDTNAGAFDAAATRLAAVLKTRERDPDALFEMAVLAERRGQPADAQRWLEKASELEGPRQLRAGLALVDFHLRRGRAAAALDTAKRLAGKAPDDLQVLLAYARSQLASGELPGMRNTLTNATRLADFDATVQVQIALLQLAGKNLPGAAYSLEKALSGSPGDLAATALMADVELRQGEVARAEQRARGLVDSQPKRAIGHSLLGDAALARGQPALALEAFRRAHQVEPSTDTLLRLFQVMSMQNPPDAALRLAQGWVDSHPNDLKVRVTVADALARNGNLAAARIAYEAALKLKPGDAYALNNLANVLLRLKDPAAVKVAEQALASDPANPTVIDTLGWALFKAGDLDRALQTLRDARLREPDNPDIRYHLAAVLAAGGRATEALAELDVQVPAGRPFEHAADAAALRRTLR